MLTNFVNRQTAEMFSDRETFTPPTFCITKEEAGGEGEYQGWVNSATMIFNVYFFQEKKCVEAFRKLIHPRGTICYKKALRLFRMTQIPIDADFWGLVCVSEIVDNYLSETAV